MMLRDNRGMTLIETISSFFILVTITVTVNTYMVGFFKTNRSVKNISEATRIGYRVLEDIRLEDFDLISSGSTTEYPPYECSWEVDSNTEIDMKTINLTVKWFSRTTGPRGSDVQREHIIELSTICAR